MSTPDPSRAVERTALAWNRTGLSFVATGAAVLRLLAPSGRAAIGIVMVAVGAAASAHAWRPRPQAGRNAVRTLAVVTTLLACGVLVVALLPPR